MKKLIALVALLSISTLSNAQWNQFTTPYGYISLGPANSSYAHIYTDRNKFIFNKDIYLLTGGISAYSQNDLSLKTNGDLRMIIKKSNGNVGIGTSNPLDKLHVNGNLLMPTYTQVRLGTENNNTGHVRMLVSTPQHYNNFWDIKGNLYFRRNNNGSNQGAIMGLQNDGTVTIGVWEKYNNSVTDTDGHKLMVNGGIMCEKIKVIEDVPNSDHVFESDYYLRPLEEVKSFVEENKHLPEIPSAKEFQENGYNIGEMDDVLLRKVEELTLYMIEMKEKVDHLEAENAELKSAIENTTNK